MYLPRNRVIGLIEIFCDDEVAIILPFPVYKYATWFFEAINLVYGEIRNFGRRTWEVEESHLICQKIVHTNTCFDDIKIQENNKENNMSVSILILF